MIEKENSKKVILFVLNFQEKYKVPKEFHYIDSRELFLNALVTKSENLTEELKW